MKKISMRSYLRVGALILLISGFGISYFFFKKQDRNTYFQELPITKWTNSRFPSPCLPIQIDEMTIISELDLGFRGDFSISREILDQIEEKKYLKSKTMYGFGGKEYEKRLYEVPKVKIGNLAVYDACVQEEAKDFRANGTHGKNGEKPTHIDVARIGWEVFQSANLLLDLGNKKVAVCDSVRTLQKNGYNIASMIQVPLILERGFIEINAVTASGALRCVLDTGCTVNCLPLEDPIPDKFIWDPEVFEKNSEFKISGKEFGPICFYRMPIQLPIHVEAFLGMEFFKDHIVFLDFKNGIAYLGSSKDSPFYQREDSD